MKKTIGGLGLVSLSGGMDSTTVLAQAVKECDEVLAVGFCYGSKHNVYENAAAMDVAQFYGVPFNLIDLSSFMCQFKSNLMKAGGDIPEGHYEADNMSQTVVPGRNIIFASILSGIAWSRGAKTLWLGIHAGDHAIYPDCRPDFFESLRRSIALGTDGRVDLQAPFLHGNKKTIIKWGLEQKVPYHLTRTCYKDQTVACGKCGACNERREAFLFNGIEDPIQYAYRGPLPEKP